MWKFEHNMANRVINKRFGVEEFWSYINIPCSCVIHFMKMKMLVYLTDILQTLTRNFRFRLVLHSRFNFPASCNCLPVSDLPVWAVLAICCLWICAYNNNKCVVSMVTTQQCSDWWDLWNANSYPCWLSYQNLNWIDRYWASGCGMLSLIDIERIKSQTNKHTFSHSMCSEVQYLIPWEASSSLPIFSSSVDSPPYWSESKSDQPLSSCLTSILRNALPRTAALV